VKWTPRSKAAKQLQVLMLTILDSGLRISEALNLERNAIDFDQSTLTVLGKGRKERTVPISKELRRRLWAYLKTHEHALVFTTLGGGPQSIRNVQHAMRRARKALAIPQSQRFSPHVLRHTFATGYLRRGGDPFRLQRILGHSTLQMTLRYCSLEVGDLCAVHDRYSPLASGF
jgi:integrase/recombinase XerD